MFEKFPAIVRNKWLSAKRFIFFTVSNTITLNTLTHTHHLFNWGQLNILHPLFPETDFKDVSPLWREVFYLEIPAISFRHLLS
jgi:hypothetical protein